MFLEPLQQQLQVRDLAPPPVGINGEQKRQGQHADRDGPQLIRNAGEPLPEQSGQSERQQNHEAERPPPQLRLLAFKAVGRPRGTGRQIGVQRHEEG